MEALRAAMGGEGRKRRGEEEEVRVTEGRTEQHSHEIKERAKRSRGEI